jgi:CRP/FNR family transcriptional regulator, cyclic AMP receptor protein
VKTAVKRRRKAKARPPAAKVSAPLQAASLSSLDLFRELPAEALRALEKGSQVHEMRAGHVFFQPGQTGELLFLLEKGRVQTFRTFGAKKLVIAELKPPAVFGEMGCVGQRMYHCYAQATAPTRIRTISRSDLDRLLEAYPVITRRLLDLVSQRFVRVLLDWEATSFRHLIPRLASLLLEKADGDLVQNVTHRDLAEYLHVYRESATAALGDLRKAGIISIGRKKISILDRARLERAAREGSPAAG